MAVLTTELVSTMLQKLQCDNVIHFNNVELVAESLGLINNKAGDRPRPTPS